MITIEKVFSGEVVKAEDGEMTRTFDLHFGNIGKPDKEGDIFDAYHGRKDKVWHHAFNHDRGAPIGSGPIRTAAKKGMHRFSLMDTPKANEHMVMYNEPDAPIEASYRFTAKEYSIIKDAGYPWMSYHYKDAEVFETSVVDNPATEGTGITPKDMDVRKALAAALHPEQPNPDAVITEKQASGLLALRYRYIKASHR